MDIQEWMEHAGNEILDMGVEYHVDDNNCVIINFSQLLILLDGIREYIPDMAIAGAIDTQKADGMLAIYFMLRGIHDSALVKAAGVPDDLGDLDE